MIEIEERDDMSELEYLRLFYQLTDFGPAHEDVVYIINDRIESMLKRKIPKMYLPE